MNTVRPVAIHRRHDVVSGLARVLDYLFGLLYTLLVIRLVLAMIGARKGTGFADFIVGLTGPFYAPFQGIVPTNTIDGAHPIVWPLVVAILAYMLLHGALRGLLRLLSHV